MTRALLLACLLPPMAWAQQAYTISTVAGEGVMPFAGNNGPALNAFVVSPQYVAGDAAGNVYFIDIYYQQVFKVTPGGTVSIFAGTGTAGFSGDNGPAAAAQLNNPLGLAVDSAGNAFIMDNGNARIRKVAPNGTITTFALQGGRSVSVDAQGNLYACVSLGNQVFKVTPDGKSTLFAGTGQAGPGGDGQQAVNAQLNFPINTKVDPNGNVYVVDSHNNKIRKITPQGVISTVAGNGNQAFTGDGQQAINAGLSGPSAVAIGADGSVFIADTGNGRIRVVSPQGVITTYAGGTSLALGSTVGDGPPSQAQFLAPVDLALDPQGNLLLADESGRIRRITPTAVTTVAGLLPTVEPAENGPATSAALLTAAGVAVDAGGEAIFADSALHRIFRVSAAGIITTLAGNGLSGESADGTPATSVGNPQALAFDQAGNLYYTAGNILRRIAPDGTVLTLAGSGPGFAGDKQLAVAALLNNPTGVAVDAAGNIYIADSNNNRVRRIDVVTKTIDTVAGNGKPAYGGDNGPATAASLQSPYEVVVDGSGNLYISDTLNERIRKVTPDGTISTVAGTGTSGDLGEGGPAMAAQVNTPGGLAVDGAGNIYIADMFGSRVREVSAATGTIATIAGTGQTGFSGDGGFATSAKINGPVAVAVDGAGDVYFTDSVNRRVRKLTPAQITPAGVLNAASLLAGAVAPGEIVTINVAAGTGSGGTQVLFDGNPATVIAAQGNQVTAVVPYEVAGQATSQLQLMVNGQNTNSFPLPVAATAPGVFTQDGSGMGAGQILNADGSVNADGNAAAVGDTVTIMATGEGQTNPAGVDGQADTDPAPMPVAMVSVQIGGMNAPVTASGGVVGMPAGYFQVSAQVPAGVTGDVPVVVTVGGVGSQAGVTMAVQ